MALSNRARASSAFRRAGIREATLSPGGVNDPSEFTRDKRASWARLSRKIFEADPLLCCTGATMKIVSLITGPKVVDRILRHLESDACNPFEPRGPPAAASVDSSTRRSSPRWNWIEVPIHYHARTIAQGKRMRWLSQAPTNSKTAAHAHRGR